MKIFIDPNKCVGCNMCEDISEGAMGTAYGKNGKAGVNPKADLKNKKTLANLKIVAEACPMQAVKIEA